MFENLNLKFTCQKQLKQVISDLRRRLREQDERQHDVRREVQPEADLRHREELVGEAVGRVRQRHALLRPTLHRLPRVVIVFSVVR